MKKKRNTRSRDSLGILLTLLFLLANGYGAFWSIRKFYESMNVSLTKMNEKPIATITFKHKTAQRKFDDRMIWDRLRQNSPVYDGDTIRTAPESEATIYFADGNIMDLDENTMAQIFFHDGQAALNVDGGAVVVNSSGAKNGAVLNMGGSSVTVSAGSSISTSFSSDGETAVNVLKGDAVFSDETGLTKAMDAGTSIALNAEHEEQIIPQITVTAPQPNRRLLNFGGEGTPVLFKWNAQNLSDDDFLVVEISDDRKFGNIVQSERLSGSEATIILPDGVSYWRIFPDKAGRDYSAKSKVSVFSAPPPELIVPESRAEFSYKAEKPDIRFTWSTNDWITAFDFEVADNPKMENPVIKQRTTTASSFVSTLGSGTWYWRVTPFYTLNNIGFAEPSIVRAFTISQRNTIGVAELILPAANETINTALKDQIAFSWKNNSEVSAYEIKVGSDPTCYEAKIVQKSAANFLSIRPSDYDMKKGTWYWCVTQYDAAGDISEQSEVRRFYTDEIKFEQRVFYPPENFVTADSNLSELRFTWRTNIPGDNKFQIARDKEFKNLVLNETDNEKYFEGVQLSAGNYYWRISAADSPEQYSTPARALRVVSKLGMPVLTEPRRDTTLTVLADSRTSFNWTPVEEADYYQFRFYSLENPGDAIYSQTLKSTGYALDLTGLKDGSYGWSVQAASEESALSTRRIGESVSSSFRIQQLRNVRLVLPANGAAIDGIEALSYPQTLTWSSEQEVQSATLTLSRNANGYSNPIVSVQNPQNVITLPRLSPGTYYWTVRAVNTNGVNISATAPRSFTVTNIASLSKPVLSLPAANTVYGAAQIRASRTINFTWQPVQSATSYSFTLRDERGQVLINRTLSATSYTLPDMAVLKNGRFTWSVQAVQNLSDGTFVRRSDASTNVFTISLPAAGDIIINDTGVLYGM